MPAEKNSLRNQILNECYCSDRPGLLRLLKNTKPDYNQKLTAGISQSIERVRQRKTNKPKARYNQSLPFYQHLQTLIKAIESSQVVIVCGETGSGKTTQLPQLCLDLGLANFGKIGHTQPRRIAANSVSRRIAEELQVEFGQAVGYKVRFNDKTNKNSYLKLMTDGILLAEIQHDPLLNEYQTIIIDEAHERSLNIDLLLGYLKHILPRRPDLKLIITSATIDPKRFSRYFDEAPMLMISGRTYPVEMRYRPADEDGKERDFNQILIDAVEELCSAGIQDTLIFLPGERQIREAAEILGRHFQQRFEILPLYARLTQKQQQLIFQSHRKPRIVLSTNVAETSLTVPGIRYVIDSGLARLSRYSWRAKIQRLPIEKISQASANQRAGRCGRLAPGICIRLYSEDDFNNRDEFTDAEILRTNLASVILQMDSLRVGSIYDFDFIEPPDSRLINDGFRLLFELRATDGNDRINKTGRKIARLHTDPRLAKMLIRASELGCLDQILPICGALSIQNPRDGSVENRQASREKQQQWQDETSDFLFWSNLWCDVENNFRTLSRNQFSKWCRKHFLSYLRIREWIELTGQLKQQMKDGKYHFNTTEADSDTIHRSILSGIPSHIAYYDQDKKYQATRGRQLTIFPGSFLANKTPKWMMAFSLIDTSRLFAHVVARCNPLWIMADCVHLHQYEYLEPHWQPRQGRVAAFRTTRVYGLQIESNKRVNYASIDAKVSRQIFIREALVEGDYHSKLGFLRHNRKLIDYYQQQEERERRRDILISDEQLFEFYDSRLPDTAVDAPSFEHWVSQLSPVQLEQLRLFDQDLVQQQPEKNEFDFPQFLQIRQQQLKLEYVFDPADQNDGVSVLIPLPLLNQFEGQNFDYLVPGLLEDKIQALIRSLPKQLRKNFIPAKEFASACFNRLNQTRPFYSELSQALLEMTGVKVNANQWQPDKIDKHLRMNFSLQKDGRIIANSRSLQQLKNEFEQKATESFTEQIAQNDVLSRSGLTEWSFGELPKQQIIKQQGHQINIFPALVDYEESVAIELFETAENAAFYHATGIARLISFRLTKEISYLHKNLPHIDQSALMYISLDSKQSLIDDILMSSIFSCFLTSDLPENSEQFDQLIEKYKAQLISIANEISTQVFKILQLYRATRSNLQETELPLAHQHDIKLQMENLVYQGFARDIKPVQLPRIPAYFQAIQKRIVNFENNNKRVETLLVQVQDFWLQYVELTSNETVDAGLLDELRWMLEEYRIACFAQPMKTRMPVSENRLQNKLNAITKEATKSS